MKEEAFKFSLTDFLAYLFPGTITMLALGALLSLSPLRQFFVRIPLNLVTGLVLVPIAYFFGIVNSSIEASFAEKPHRLFKSANEVKKNIQLDGFETEVLGCFNDIFGDHGGWSA